MGYQKDRKGRTAWPGVEPPPLWWSSEERERQARAAQDRAASFDWLSYEEERKKRPWWAR